MREHDPEIEESRAMHCAVVLERTSPTWKLDRKESTKLSLNTVAARADPDCQRVRERLVCASQ